MSKKDIITDFIISQINQGKYKEGSKIMSEPLLSERLGVSRFTVREALKSLTEKGIIYKIQGSGNYIRNTKSNLKYIVISINENKVLNENTGFHSAMIEKLKTNIQTNGYIPYTHTEQSHFYSINAARHNCLEDYLSLDISEIAGLISIDGNYKYYTTFEKEQIPIISVFNNFLSYPYVNMNYRNFITKLTKLIKKYKFQNPFIFTIEPFEFIIKEKFQKINYSYKSIAIQKKSEANYISIKNTIKEIKNQPDVIIFTDDTLYSSAALLFSEYEMFSKAKIITHSNNNEIYPPGYDICRLTYYPEDFANATTDTLFSLIRKEPPKKYNQLIDYKVINEEALRQ